MGSILQVESSFNAQMQTQIIAQIQQGTNPDSTRNKGKKKKNTSPNWTRKRKKKKKNASEKIWKINAAMGICFGFCVWFLFMGFWG